MEGNTLLRSYQYRYDDLGIGIHVIKNKIKNQREALNTFRNKPAAVKKAIAQLDAHIEKLELGNPELTEILGIEGSSARIYFAQMFDEADWKGRKPRIKNDYINSTLDIAYMQIFHLVDAILGIYGFDTYYGVLHKCFYMRKSLVCDLIEPLRPIVDLCIRKAIHLGQCKEEDFEIINHRYLLEWGKNPEYIAFIMKAILDRKDDIFLYLQGYYRSFMKQKKPSEFPVFEIR